MEKNQPNNHQNSFNTIPERNLSSIQSKQDFFFFLKKEEKHPISPSFFSRNGLKQDIIQVTNAEPDICLEVFYALYNTLWPQLEKLVELKKLGKEDNPWITSLKDAWTNFLGCSLSKGILWSPEKLMEDPQDVEENFQKNGGEKQVFLHLDKVLESILILKTKLADYPREISQREEIMASIELVQGFYTEFRNKVKYLVTMIIENKESKKNYQALQNLLEPKAVMMSDIFDHHWVYRIPRKTAKKLLSLNKWKGHMKNYSDEGATHRVAALPDPEPLVYFKANGGAPIQPEKEFMLYSLYRRLQIPVPGTALLILTDVFVEDSDYYYAVQASEAVIGESALEACKNPETLFDQEAYVSQVIGALLTNPSDGSFKNFKYSPRYKTLIGIDNDLLFKPEFIGDHGKTVNVKSIVYLLPHMDLVIPETIKTLLTTLDPNLTIFSWLKELSMKNRKYSLLFARLAFQKARYSYQNILPPSEMPSLANSLKEKVLVDPDLHGASFYPQILISRNLLSNISEKFQIIEKTLLNHRSVSPQILFEEISPILGKYYRKLRIEFSDPEEALDALWVSKNKNYIDSSRYSELNNLPDENLFPEMFLNEYKNKLIFDEKIPPLDQLIQRHSQRKKKNLFNLSQVVEELRLLKQEGITDSQSPRDIINFWYNISKQTKTEDHLRKEATSLFFNLPGGELKWLFTLEKYFCRTNNDVPKNLRSIPITGAFMNQRIFNLTESENQILFDKQGNIRKNASLNGRSNVACFPEKNPELYLKQYPEFPGYEFASTSFMRLLGIKYENYHDLIIINDSYPVLISQNVAGDPVFQIWNNPEAFSNLDPFHTGLHIICAMLINPEDGKEDNFILSPDGKYLIPIDNDHYFLPSTFQRVGSIWKAWTVNTALQTKSLLFCLDEMNKPIPLEVKQHILSLNFDSLLTSWIKELIKIDDRYHHLVDSKQRDAFLKNGTALRISFYPQFIQHLYWKAHKIQHLLRSTSEQTPLNLLKAVEPFAARCYQESFLHGNTLQSRFKFATKELYPETKTNINKSRVSVMNTQSMMRIIDISEKDLQEDVTFHKMWPLQTLKNLEQLTEEREQKRKMEQDLFCELDDTTEERIWTILFGNPILEANLKNFFLNPSEGLILKRSKLITSRYLTYYFAQTPDQGAKIKFLSLPNSPLLDSKTIGTLVEGCPNLEYLNINGCIKLEEIVTAKGEWSLLTRLEANECLNLKKVVSRSPIKILRIGTHQQIEILIEKYILDIFKISTKTNKFDFLLEKEDSFEIKPLDQEKSLQPFFQNTLLNKGLFDKYFRNPRITIGTTHSIQSPESLGVFVTSLDLRTSEFNYETFQKIVQLKLINLEILQLPRLNGVGTDLFEDLVQGEWPKLCHLDLSDNEINDEGLGILSRGNWPLLKIIDMCDATITKKGLINFMLIP